MMKRLLAILLCLVLAAGLLPVSAGGAELSAETPDLPFGGSRPLPVQSNSLDKGGMLIDVSTYDFDVSQMSDAAFNSLVNMMVYGDIVYYKEGTVEYLDVDRDGTLDLKSYKNGEDTYLTPTAKPSVQGFCRIDMSEGLVGQFESDGHEYFSYVVFAFAAPDKDYGTYTIDMSGASHHDLVYHLSAAGTSVIGTMSFLSRQGRFNAVMNEPLELTTDLDKDGHYDLTWSAAADGYAWFEMNSDTNLVGDYEVVLTSEEKAAAKGELAGYCSRLIFKFPPSDYGELIIDLDNSNSDMLFLFTDKGLAGHDSIMYLCSQGRIRAEMGESVMECYLDVDKDGKNDLLLTTGADGFNLYERLSGFSTWGTWRFFLSKSDIAAMKASGCEGCYSIVTFQFPGWQNPFYDVERGKYYYSSVLWAVNRTPQITEGTDEHHFSPNNPCTRAQVVTFLWRANGCPSPTITTHPFQDVKSSAYYYTAMLWAVENGITTGTDAPHFGPNNPCTRKQIVTFLWRAKGSPKPKSTYCPFTDVNPKASYYTAMLWAVENDVTTGTSPSKFSPEAVCTRGQVVTFLDRVFGPVG